MEGHLHHSEDSSGNYFWEGRLLKSGKLPRVLHVAECANGGVTLFVRRLIEGLRDEFAFGVACPTSSDLYENPPPGAAVHPVRMPHQVSVVGDLAAALMLRRVVVSNGYNIVHLSASKAGLIGVISTIGLNVNVIFTPHALRSQAYPKLSPMRASAVLAERFICRRADAVVAVSPDEALQIIDGNLAPPRLVHVLENGVDLNDLSGPSSVTRAEIGVPAGARLVGSIARLSAQKAPLDFVRVAAAVGDQFQDAHFVMVGSGPLEDDVRRAVEGTNLEGRFSLLGWRSDALEILKLFDVFVSTSRYEGFPFTLLEAAAARKPLVCTTAAGIRCFVQHGESGLLAKIGDWKSMAEEVCAILADSAKRNRLANGALEMIAKPRGQDVMVERWAALYHGLEGGALGGSSAQDRPANVGQA